MSTGAEEEHGTVAVACRFVRGRNALLCHADFGPLFMDLYLHLGGLGVVLRDGSDARLKLLVAALTLHAAARPRGETVAWTLHFEERMLNVFAVAENPTGRVTGQVFTRQVRAMAGNVLHAETAHGGGGRRRSSVDFEGDGVLAAAEAYYVQSEQRPARFFALGGDAFALLAAQPDCDLQWLRTAGPAELGRLAVGNDPPPLETRIYRFECGCTPSRLAEAIGPAVRGDLDGLFGGESHVRVTCPRCGQVQELTRADFGAP